MGCSPPDPVELAIFETEVAETAAKMQEHVLRIERGEAESEPSVAELLRLAHNVKGAALAVEAGGVARLAHALEERVMGWRGERALEAAQVDLVLHACDMLVSLTVHARSAEADDAQAAERRARADALCAELQAPPGASPIARPAPPASAPEAAACPVPVAPRAPAPAAGGRETLRVGRSLIEGTRDSAEVGRIQLKQLRERFRGLRASLKRLREIRLPRRGDGPAALGRLREELIEVQGAVGAAAREFGCALSQLETAAKNTCERATELSLVPCEPLIGQLERAARDTARLLGRRVRFVVEGGELDVDKGLVEELKGPLIHAVRNAVDHGLEPPAERLVAGKEPVGELRLALHEQGDLLRIMLTDDGRGIDREAVRARLGAGAAELDDRGLLARLMRAGLSTRDTATQISGRGIGLGAIAALADRLRGEVTLTSPPGAGTTVCLSVPRRLSSLDGLIVASGALRAVIPVTGVLGVEAAGDRARVPSLASALGLPDDEASTHVLTLAGRARRGRFGVRGPGQRDDDVVQRPVGEHLGRVPFASGVTVLASGTPAWILDPLELADAFPADPADERVRRVLLVDDSCTMRTRLHGVLVGAGYDVVLADDGLTALDRLEAMSFDVVVSDVQMPRLDGFGLLAACRRRVPVVLCSTDDRPETTRRAREQGAAAFLVKDEELGCRLDAVLADVLSRRREPLR